MAPPTISLRLVPGVRQSHKRAIGMLDGHSDLCANRLLGLPENDAKYIRFSMEMWTGGLNKPSTRFHRFDGTDYFVFKHVAMQHRFYGFLCHPLPKTDPSFWLCVLTTYSQKKEDATDKADLQRVKTWMDAPSTKAAIRSFYPDETKVEK